MSSNIRLKRSSVPGKIPTTSNLDLGEFAVNTHDGNLYTKKLVDGTETIVSFFGSETSDNPVSFNDEELTTTAEDQVVDSFDATIFRTAKYIIQVEADGNFHSTEILLLHDDSNTHMTEYATIFSNQPLAEFSSELVAGTTVNLLITPLQENTTIKLQRVGL